MEICTQNLVSGLTSAYGKDTNGIMNRSIISTLFIIFLYTQTHK